MAQIGQLRTEYYAILLCYEHYNIVKDGCQVQFDKINAQTPAAIIELGFLGSEHGLLKNKRAVLAMGISDGIDSFLRGMLCQ